MYKSQSLLVNDSPRKMINMENSPMQIDNESLSSTSSPRPDEWSALRMKPSDIDFENTRKYILVVDDNIDMRYVHINMNLVLLYLPECKHLW